MLSRADHTLSSSAGGQHAASRNIPAMKLAEVCQSPCHPVQQVVCCSVVGIWRIAVLLYHVCLRLCSCVFFVLRVKALFCIGFINDYSN